MSNYLKHFERELSIMRNNLEEGDRLTIEPFIEDIESIIHKFSDEGHSGGSAPYASGALAETIKRVLRFEPLTGIMGTDDEWSDIRDYGAFQQNKRLSSVFKNKDGTCYYLNAIVWKGEEDYDTFTGGVEGFHSSMNIKAFPFIQKTFYVDVYREPYDEEKHGKDCNYTQCGDGDYVYKIKDMKQLEEVLEYYDVKKK